MFELYFIIFTKPTPPVLSFLQIGLLVAPFTCVRKLRSVLDTPIILAVAVAITTKIKSIRSPVNPISKVS